ncbi:hypothetical protein BT93_L5504 [Corymbia citriodora subsp. variegata]|uniref:DUF4220 domain-containing protein n=1 Tax=Corymbia citriodora subsp. variegata TaxID=360336 RepID=A0A8T0CSC8_CORYI|nr:hypothetical protein BT93_L5504 [Corymbia citriodora subsp. variegata]
MAYGSISALWNKWNIRGFVMLSLLLQTFLILFSPLRKKTANPLIISLLWLAYLMADWVVAFTIGLISHNQSNSSTCVVEVDGALLAFWASFLLLHLGGPDTITAFSMEDSSLWRRHLLSLVFQVGSAIYVFVQVFPTNKLLLIPTMLVFLAGVIKNVERTVALNFSSLPKLRKWALSQREHPDDVAHEFVKDPTFPQVESSCGKEPELVESIMVKHAFYFFQMFVVLLGDLMFTSQEREVSRSYFQNVSTVDALRIISVELQFMYEALHTKMLVICSKWSYIFRVIAFTIIVTAFFLFSHLKKHHQLPELDVKITYSLLFGGIALDVIALLMLVFSDWTVAGIKQVSFLNKFVSAMNDLRKPRFATCEEHPNAVITYSSLDTPLIFRRWSESMSACNLLLLVLGKSTRKMWKRGGRCGRPWHNISTRGIYMSLLRMISKGPNWSQSCVGKIVVFLIKSLMPGFSRSVRRIANTDSVSKNPFIKELWIFIFTEVKRKSKDTNDEIKAKKIFEAKGDLFLESLFLESTLNDLDRGNLLEYITKVNFDSSIIMWHLATEVWYNKEKPTVKNEEREFSKILSDYMMYLVFNQFNLVSTVAGIAPIKSSKTFEHIFKTIGNEIYDMDVEGLCQRLYTVHPNNDCGGSVLNRGIDLAREMERLGDMKWKVMSGVWVEMLSYAAIHTKGETHMQVLSKGGELLTFVWLLMAHFGCYYKPEWGIYADYIDHRLLLSKASSFRATGLASPRYSTATDDGASALTGERDSGGLRRRSAHRRRVVDSEADQLVARYVLFSPVTDASWEARYEIFEEVGVAGVTESAASPESELVPRSPSRSRTNVFYESSRDYVLGDQYRNP